MGAQGSPLDIIAESASPDRFKSRPASPSKLENWPEIDFTDDRDGCLFTTTVHRKEIGGSVEPEIGSEESSAKAESSPKGSQKTSQKIIDLMQGDPEITIAELALSVGVTDRAIKWQIERLKAQGRIRRIGPDKGGHWEVVE